MIEKKMVATEGHVLTNGEAYGKVIYLGCNDTEENWWEISDEEYEAIKDKEESPDAFSASENVKEVGDEAASVH